MNLLRTLAQNPGKTALSIAAAVGLNHGLTQAGQWQAAQDQVLIAAPDTPNTLGPLAAPPSFYTQRFGDLNAQAPQGFSHPMKNPLINNPVMDFYATRSLLSGEKMGRIFMRDAGWSMLLGALGWGALALIQRWRRAKPDGKTGSDSSGQESAGKRNQKETTTRDGHGDPWATLGADRTQTLDVNGNRIGGDPTTLKEIAVAPASGTAAKATTSAPQILIANEANRGSPANDPTEFNVLNAQTPFAEFNAVTTYGGPNSKYGSLNEDSAGVVISKDGIAVVVTDGAGGEGAIQTDAKGNEYKGGYEAGKTATQTIVESLQGNPNLATALQLAHDKVLKSPSRGEAAVAVVHVNNDLTIKAARVGDTQILIVRNGKIFFRSIPQNKAWLFHYIIPRVPNLAKVYKSNVASKVVHLLGFTPGKDEAPLNLDPQATHEKDLKEYSRFYFDPIQGEVGDQILLMSDGVIDNVSEYEILELAKKYRGEKLAQTIRQLALERNNTTHPEKMITIQLDQGQTVKKKVTRDNITVGVLELKSTETGTDMGDEEEEEGQDGEAPYQHPLSAAARKSLRRNARTPRFPLMDLPVDAEIARVAEVRNPPQHDEDDDWLDMPTDTSPSKQQGTRPPDSDEDWDILPPPPVVPVLVAPEAGDEIDTLDLEPQPEIAVASGLGAVEIDLGDSDGESFEIDLTPADSAGGEDWLDDVVPSVDADDEITTLNNLPIKEEIASVAGLAQQEENTVRVSVGGTTGPDTEITDTTTNLDLMFSPDEILDEAVKFAREFNVQESNTNQSSDLIVFHLEELESWKKENSQTCTAEQFKTYLEAKVFLENPSNFIVVWETDFKNSLARLAHKEKDREDLNGFLSYMEIQHDNIKSYLSRIPAEWEKNKNLKHRIEFLIWKIEHIIEVNRPVT